MKAFLREPLLHFLLLGAALFALYGYLDRGASDDDPQTIVVDRARLLSFVQYRTRDFDAARSREFVDSLPPEDLERLIQDYVREEALYREAKALQLDKHDYVSRLRLIQQLEFITRAFADEQVELADQEIQRYYDAHESQYWVQPKVTFTHVFFSNERHGAERALALARTELRELNETRAPFEEAPARGDRFLYHVNYVDRGPDEIASHFGTHMRARLFALEPSETLWRGPFQSSYGAHLVLLTNREPGYSPPLAAVRSRVEQAARQAALDARLEESIQSVVKSYKVEVRREEARRKAP